MEEFDYIIVGAGSAGCVLADRLSADGRRSVLLLEAGGGDRRFWVRAPIGYGATFFDEAVNWKYNTEPDPGLGGRSGYWPRGKVVGGSSSINALLYLRGLAEDFDDWRAAGAVGWGWSDVEPAFSAFERHIRGDGIAQGDGPLFVSNREAEYHPIKRRFYEAARAIGLPLTDDMNGANPEGVGGYPLTTRNGLRCSAADAFLHPARRRSNLSVRTKALATRILFDGVRACGVSYRRGGAVHTARARAEVVVSAGAVNTPQLLQISGVGPGALLQDLGVEAVRANDAVGGGLQDHLGVNYFYRSKEPTLNGTLRSWPGRLKIGLQFLLTRSGPMSLSVNQIGGLVRSSPNRARPDTQLYFNPLSYTTTYVDKRPLLLPDPFPGFIMGFNACRPTSRGRVDAASVDPADAPRITPNSLSSNTDVADVVAGARLIGRLQETDAMRGLIDGAPAFDPAHASDDEIVADFRERSGTVFHPCGTCRMGPDDGHCVVDPMLRAHGVEGLRVVDASIFPNITSANTNAPTIMVAWRAADIIIAGSNQTDAVKARALCAAG